MWLFAEAMIAGARAGIANAERKIEFARVAHEKRERETRAKYDAVLLAYLKKTPAFSGTVQ